MTTSTPLISRQNDDGMTVQQKNIYCSHLQQLGDGLVKFKTTPRASQYPKNGCTHYAYVELADGLDYCLSLEGHLVDVITTAPQNEWVRVDVEGSQDVPTVLTISATPQPNGAVQEQEEDAPAQTRRDAIQQWHKEETGDEPPPDLLPPATPAPTVDGTTGPDLLASAWHHVAPLVAASYPEASPEAKLDAISRLASTLFIHATRR